MVVGDIVLFKETTRTLKSGKKVKSSIAYDDNGIVVFCKHPIKNVYARVKSIEDRGNYYLVTAENIVYDLYRNMPYNELLKVLDYQGYKIGFTYDNIGGKFIFAYHPLNNSCLQISSWENTLSEIKMYCPGVRGNDISVKHKYFYASGGNYVVFLSNFYHNNINYFFRTVKLNFCFQDKNERGEKDAKIFFHFYDKDGKILDDNEVANIIKIRATDECKSYLKGKQKYI